MPAALADFPKALLEPDLPPPGGLVDPKGRPAGARFDVYRNNVLSSLTSALGEGFPVLRKLVGAAFFDAMAGVFVRARPPRSPLIMLYGAEFAGFVEAFPPAARLPYLGDVARLEYARRAAYHAADAAPIPPEALAAPGIEARRLILAPALRVVASHHPVMSIWQANMVPGAPPAAPRPETVLITRPGFDPVMDLIDAPAPAFLAACREGRSLTLAIEVAGPALDLSALLTLLLAREALTGTGEALR